MNNLDPQYLPGQIGEERVVAMDEGEEGRPQAQPVLQAPIVPQAEADIAAVAAGLVGEQQQQQNPGPRGPLPPAAPSPSSASSELLYSGLYAYHIPTNTWTLLRCDVGSPKPSKPTLRSRVGHSMLFHPQMRKLFIFAGQRSKEYLNDFFSYNVDTDEIELISDSHKKLKSPCPAAGFTQRATIDPDLNEIYIFSVSCPPLCNVVLEDAMYDSAAFCSLGIV